MEGRGQSRPPYGYVYPVKYSFTFSLKIFSSCISIEFFLNFSQSALRLFTFRQPHKVLGIEEMKNTKYGNKETPAEEAEPAPTVKVEDMQQ